MKIKKLIIPLMIILLLPVIYAGTLTSTSISTYTLEEKFNTTDIFTGIPMKSRDMDSGHNWSFSAGCEVDANNAPVNSSLDDYIFDSYSYGLNYTTSCGFGFNRLLQGWLPINHTNDLVIIKYNYSVQESSGAQIPLQLVLRHNLTTVLTFYHSWNRTPTTPTFFFARSIRQVGEDNRADCNMSTDNNIIPFTAEFVIILDQKLNTYSWYIDGASDGNCENVELLGHELGESFGNIMFAQGVNEGELTEIYVDDIEIGVGSVDSEVSSDLRCPFPLLFCDEFDYNTPLRNRNWTVYDESFSVNSSFSPIDNKLNLNQSSSYKLIYHRTENFNVNHTVDQSIAIISTSRSPVFSSEFDLTIYNNTPSEIDDCLRYQGFDSGDTGVFTMWFCGNESIYYFQVREGIDYYDLLCDDCLTADQSQKIKINTFFKQRAGDPYNSTIQSDRIDVNINGVKKGQINNFVDNTSYNLNKYSFIKDYDTLAIIDNYAVMVGTDTSTDTSDFYFTPVFEEILDTIVVKEGTGELIDAVDSIWEDFGLKTQASRIFVGVFLMFFLALILFGAFISTKTPVSVLAIGVIELFFMIFLIYIKLLPAWIGFVLVVIVGGIAALIFKMSSG